MSERVPATRVRYCHCLCSHNHPEAMGICRLPGYRMLLVEEGPGPWRTASVCRRCAALAPEIVPEHHGGADAPV